MLDNQENERPPTVEEQYISAGNASNLRVEAGRRTAADMIIAAGMNPHRTGLQLARLMTEWDASSKPAPMDAAAIERLANSYEREPAGSQHAGLVRCQPVKAGEPPEFVIPLVLAQREAQAWHLHELKILLQRMKTLPTVRDGLAFKARELAVEDGEHAVCAVLLWWLDPKCNTCKGRGLRVARGTNRTSSKACGICKGSGEKKVPHGRIGRLLLSHINACRTAARRSLAGKFEHNL